MVIQAVPQATITINTLFQAQLRGLDALRRCKEGVWVPEIKDPPSLTGLFVVGAVKRTVLRTSVFAVVWQGFTSGRLSRLHPDLGFADRQIDDGGQGGQRNIGPPHPAIVPESGQGNTA